MNATELLKKDHDAVKQLFTEFESAASADEKRKIFEDIREELLIHATIEEEIFYPALRKANSSEAKEEVEEALREHQAVKAMLNELRNMSAEDDAALIDKMRTLSRNVQHHVQEEEGKLFATAEQLGQDRLSQLGEQLQQRKQELMKTGANTGEQKS